MGLSKIALEIGVILARKASDESLVDPGGEIVRVLPEMPPLEMEPTQGLPDTDESPIQERRALL